MADYETELAFVGRFWRAAEEGRPTAWRALDVVGPGMLQDAELEHWYGAMSGRFAAGEPVQDESDDDAYLATGTDRRRQVFSELLDVAFTDAGIEMYGDRVRSNFLARKQLEMLQLAVGQAGKALHSKNGAARKIAEQLASNLLSMFSAGGRSGPRNLAEIVDAELESMSAPEQPGIPFPWPRLERAALGPLIAGDVVGIAAFSNQGKSTVAANLAMNWIRRGFPVLAFPTEMKRQWVARMAAAASRVPQSIAERQQWKRASDVERTAYRVALEMIRGASIEVVNRPMISPAEVLAATRVLRRRWEGRTVVVVVDHMHRLDYGAEESNKMAGRATAMLRNAASDLDVIWVLLYQPRKPHQGDVYRPAAAYEIRGDSTVWNELDFCLSPFRAKVECDPVDRNAWGGPRTLVDHRGWPRHAKPKSKAMTKVDDEHLFLKLDKRRVGGEGPTIWLDIEAPCGRIYEHAGFTHE